VTAYASKDFIAAMAAQTTFFCGATNKQHGTPLRSLRRLTKVAIKLGLETPEIMDISNKIVTTITAQGVMVLQQATFTGDTQ